MFLDKFFLSFVSLWATHRDVIPVPGTGVPMLLLAVLHYQTLLHLAYFNQLYKHLISTLRVLQVRMLTFSKTTTLRHFDLSAR